MSARIYIAIPVHNRIEIARECVATIGDTLCEGGNSKHGDVLAVFDDASDAESHDLRGYDEYHRSPVCRGIEEMRKHHFTYFHHSVPKVFTHLYLCDSDSVHDPNWRSVLLGLQSKYGGAPICGYDTQSHRRLGGNVKEEHGDALIQCFAPGISYLLTREHVEKVVRWLDATPNCNWAFDWQVPALLGYRFVISCPSVVEHIGWGGRHHPEGADWDGGDRAHNPTPAVAKLRAEIVGRLRK